MPCRHAGPYVRAAVQSVLAQPECLELLVADGGSTDGSLQTLEAMASADPRLRIVSRADTGPADALNRAFRAARGTLIGWLNADDLLPPGALARAVAALDHHPEWLMVYGEGEEFNDDTGLTQRYPTLPASVGLDGFRSHCFICQPAVVFRRSMGLLLGPFDAQWGTVFDFDYWLRAFAAFPQRIGYLPHLQGRTRLHSATITSRQRRQAALETTQLWARHLGVASAHRLQCYARDLQDGLAALPEAETLIQHLGLLASEAEAWVDSEELARFRHDWLLSPACRSAQLAAEEQAVAQNLSAHLPVRLLMALHPELSLDGNASPPGPHSRLLRAVETTADTYPLLKRVAARPSPTPPVVAVTPFLKRPFGVNLIGHALELGGNGEDVRMAAGALQAAGIPCCVIHYPSNSTGPGRDYSLEPLLCDHPNGGPYAFNLVCLAGQIQARWQLQTGLRPLLERYTIAAWPWETQQWPSPWRPLLELTDELWPPSQFTASALRVPADATATPLQVMPMAAEIEAPERFCSAAARAAARASHGLPNDAVLFGYGFDLNSTAIRKNPMAALEAFQRAFPLPHLPASLGRETRRHPLSEYVALMIKTFPPQDFSPEWQWLQARAAEDSRIALIAESLPREELLALYGCCDVFLSLHRSEGFGRGMAEALQLGVDVIATHFGGNTDFCIGPLSHHVGWRLAPIPRGAYPCADGHSWAEPDLEHAAELCRKVAARRLARDICRYPEADDPSRDPAVLAAVRQRLSFSSVGARYRARLEELWADREGVASRLRWRVDRCPMGW
jgi:glycosyltransferase involved in cell wall biosynthesis